MNYVPRPGTENFHFVHKEEFDEDRGQHPKIDLLAENPDDETRLKINFPRVRARNAPDTIHGRLTPEAININQEVTKIDVVYNDQSSMVYLPHPLIYGMLKLYALRDSIEDRERPRTFAQYHALDLFMILGLTTEDDWTSRTKIFETIRNHKRFQESQHIIEQYLDTMTSPGTIRLREFIDQHRPSIQSERVEEFLEDLRELYELA